MTPARSNSSARPGAVDAFHAEYSQLSGRIADWMRDSPREDPLDRHFDRLAMDIFDFQVRQNVAYANFCRDAGGGKFPHMPTWREILPVPTDAFRFPATPMTCAPSGAAALCFETSGTTSETRGRHYLYDANLYRQSILLGWHELGLPDLPVALIVPPPEVAPRSSLSFMAATLAEAFGPATPEDETPFLVGPDGALSLAALERCAGRGRPFLLAGTALAFLHLFDALEGEGRAVALPRGCWAMETGGYKGAQRSIEKSALYGRFAKYLGLAPDFIINEYGMTELSSQFYTTGLGDAHRGPRWTRARVIDPESGHEVAPGETGSLVITDLANLGSCITIATRDLAVRRRDGFELLGRDPAASPRGCSRAAEEIFSREL